MSQNGYWVNIDNTILVRNMKKPDSCETSYWGTVKHILDVLAGFSDDEGKNIYPSISVMKQRTGRSKSTIYKTIDYLIKEKILLKDKHYCLNIPLIESLKCPSVRLSEDISPRVRQDSPRVRLSDPQSVSQEESESACETTLNKQLTNTLEKTTTTAAASLVEKLVSEGFSEDEAKQQLVDYDTERINRNYLAFNLRKTKINNPVAWLKDAIKNDWGKSDLNGLGGHPGDSPPSKPHRPSKTPTIEELTAYWLRSPPSKRQIIYDEAKVVFPFLDNQLYGVDKLSNEFTAHHAFLTMWGALHRTEYRRIKEAV